MASWRAAAQNAAHTPFNLVVLGDSIACCIGPSDYSNVWSNRLRAALGARYGLHGSGILPVGSNDGLKTNPFWSLHAGSGTIETVPFGPYQAGVGSFGGVFRLSGEASITVLVPTRPVRYALLYFATAKDSHAGIYVSSEGRKLATVGASSTGELAAQTAQITLHDEKTLSFAAASANSHAYVYGIEFVYEDGGVSVHNLAHGYARSEAWGSDVAKQLAFLARIDGGVQAAIVSLGVNDSINPTPTTAAMYRKHMRNILLALRALNPCMSLVVYDEVATAAGEHATLLPQAKVREIEREVAQEFGALFVMPPSDWPDATTAASLGYLTRDLVHPTDLGDERISAVIEPFFLPPAVPSPLHSGKSR